MFNVLNRKLTKSEAELLIKRIKLTPNIMGYSLREWIEAEYIVVGEDENGNIAGACLNYDFSNNWHKIAALYVLEEFRGKGLGKCLFYESFEKARARKKNIYMSSANPIVIKMMENLGFNKYISFFELTQAHPKQKLLFYRHTIRWLINLYRIQEIIRKIVVYSIPKNFVYGLHISE